MSVSEAVVIRQLDQMDALRRIATQATDPKEIRVRAGRSGIQLKYTDGAYVIRTLNQAFSWDWDFVADNEELLLNNGQPFEVKVRGTLTVRLNGQAVTKTQYGCQPIEMKRDGTAPVSIGDAYKGAATDAMKKCASLLGIALDLYDSDSDINTGKKAPTPEPARNVKPAGALPELEGAAGHVITLAKKLKWDEPMLAQCIEANFKIVVMPGKLTDYLALATKDELRELYRIMNS